MSLPFPRGGFRVDELLIRSPRAGGRGGDRAGVPRPGRRRRGRAAAADRSRAARVHAATSCPRCRQSGFLTAVRDPRGQAGRSLGGITLHHYDEQRQPDRGRLLAAARRHAGAASRRAPSATLADHVHAQRHRCGSRPSSAPRTNARSGCSSGWASRARACCASSSRYRGGRADAYIYSLLAGRMKTLVVYLMAMPETPELAQAAVEAGADVDRARLPVLRPARGRAGDPPRRRAVARGRHAHRRAASRCWPRRERASTCR